MGEIMVVRVLATGSDILRQRVASRTPIRLFEAQSEEIGRVFMFAPNDTVLLEGSVCLFDLQEGVQCKAITSPVQEPGAQSC
jgi:hypothetical protein